MSFEMHKTYSREEITKIVGGQPRDYLPTRDGRVVCGCFRREPSWNPDAPHKITFGEGDGENSRVLRAAEIVASQSDAIPIFIRSASKAWEYVGEYRCTGVSTDPDQCRAEEVANPDRGPIAGILWFQPVHEAA